MPNFSTLKPTPFENKYSGTIKPSDYLHSMWIRLTVDVDLLVHDCIAVTIYSLYGCCGEITPIYKKFTGKQIAPGRSHTVKKIVAGAQGCTHLADLVRPATTNIFQTMAGIVKGKSDQEQSKPFYIGGCHAWQTDGQQVLDFNSEYYPGKKT